MLKRLADRLVYSPREVALICTNKRSAGSAADCKGHHIERRDAVGVVRRIERFDMDLKLPT
jgi:hypothetical protein